MSWSERLATLVTLSTVFSLVFVVMDHKWIKVETEMQIYYSGLWKVCLKLVCPNLVASAPNVHGANTLLVMALFCAFIGVSFMIITHRYSASSVPYQYLVPAVGSFIAAALVFLGLSIYTIRISTHGISRISVTSFQWPFYLAWSTCPFFILSGFLGLVAHQHVLIQGAALSDRESRESTSSTSSSMWSSSVSSSLLWEDREKESRLHLARV